MPLISSVQDVMRNCVYHV